MLTWDAADALVCHWSNEHAMRRAGAPSGGWPSLAGASQTEGARAEMARRARSLLDVLGLGDTHQGRALAAFAASLAGPATPAEEDIAGVPVAEEVLPPGDPGDDVPDGLSILGDPDAEA